MDLSQILNLSLGDQTKIETACNEDHLKIFKVEYLCNHLSDHIQMSNLSLDDQTKQNKTSNGRRPQNNKSGIAQPTLIGSCSNLN